MTNTDIQFEINRLYEAWKKYRSSVKDPMDVPDGERIIAALARARNTIEKAISNALIPAEEG